MLGPSSTLGIARDHEETLGLIPTTELSLCPTASRVYAERPIPDEAEQAAAKWDFFGGHRVTVFESGGQIQTDFYVRKGEIWKRQMISYPGDFAPMAHETKDDQLVRRSEELLGDALSLVALNGIDRAIEVERRNYGELLDTNKVGELFEWINNAIPEPK